MTGRGGGDESQGAAGEDYERLLALHHALRLNRALRERAPLPPPSEHPDTPASAPAAPSSFDRRMIFESLRLIEPYRDHLTWYFFRRLFTDRPDLRAAFGPDLDVTRHRMVETILALALDGHDAAGGRSASADEYPQLVSYLSAEHHRHGVTSAHYPAIGAALVATMRDLAGAAWRAEYDAAWQRCYHALTAAMSTPPVSPAAGARGAVVPPRAAEPPPVTAATRPTERPATVRARQAVENHHQVDRRSTVEQPRAAAEQRTVGRSTVEQPRAAAEQRTVGRSTVEQPRAAAEQRTVGRSTVEQPRRLEDEQPARLRAANAADGARTVEVPRVPAGPRAGEPADVPRAARTTPRPTPRPYGQASAPTRATPAAAATPSHYTGTVVGRERRGSSIVLLSVRPDQPFRHEAGQYTVVESPRLPGVRRPYSMATAPGATTLEFHVRALPTGQLSRVLVTDTTIGDRLRLTPPRGAMTIDAASPREVLLVAGGTGLAPLKALASTLAATTPDRPARLFFGVRRSGDLYDMPALEAIADSYPQLRVVVAVSEDPDYPGVTGQLPDVLSRYGEQYDNWVGHDAYVAGPPQMVSATLARLRELGVPAAQLRSDPTTS